MSIINRIKELFTKPELKRYHVNYLEDINKDSLVGLYVVFSIRSYYLVYEEYGEKWSVRCDQSGTIFLRMPKIISG